MKIHVLGANGMLGRYVSKYLEGKYEVIKLTRNDIDVTVDIISPGVLDCDVVINCAGVIKPRMKDVGIIKAIKTNSIFPHRLSKMCNDSEARLIHVTTDCVFSGEKGSYVESDLHDCSDEYGKTKSLGEPQDCSVIRTSIIGEELGASRSLIEWAKSQKNKEVKGFTNHHWNGITCLQFAKICDQIMQSNCFWEGTEHFFSPSSVSKFELLQMISDAYELNLKIVPTIAEVSCDRRLSTTKNVPMHRMFGIPDLITQIKEMKEFKL